MQKRELKKAENASALVKASCPGEVAVVAEQQLCPVMGHVANRGRPLWAAEGQELAALPRQAPDGGLARG